jgi:beta-galactosidase/beta-glucuronidase
MDRIVKRLRSIGANATRAQHPLNPALLERLDAAGIFVWQEIGPWDSPGNWLEKTKALQREGLARVHQSFEQQQTHPSVFAWNLGNEVGGNGHPGQGWFVDTAAKWLKARDPGRLTALDVWGILLPKRMSRMYWHIDAIGTTSYFGWYEEPFAKPARVASLIAARVKYLRRVFPGKVIMASEFGAEGNRINKTHAHGGLAYQAALLKTTIDAYVKLPDSAGALVWNLQDFGVNPEFGGGSILRLVRGIRLVPGLNQKGLYDSLGGPKPAVKVVAAAFKRARAARG